MEQAEEWEQAEERGSAAGRRLHGAQCRCPAALPPARPWRAAGAAQLPRWALWAGREAWRGAVILAGEPGPCWLWQSPSLLSLSQGFTQKTRKIRCGSEAVFGEVSVVTTGEDQGSGHWGVGTGTGTGWPLGQCLVGQEVSEDGVCISG